ncbi:haloacid dehalogenase, type II [Acrodontium crateriforme]|uniref:Haloacid dehalogenase, type II n=1 Tax=Acrodontium crateriforme TaxID=150365 RepID=A0AAQ3MAL3_9PEZI|nr:haloacid dehalogenase, type II [Acrodontium crateriforme]
MASIRTTLAFDAYGTLLSTESIAKKLASHFGRDKAKVIATTWRRYQLEYTWRLNSMKVYEDFTTITRRSLRHALAESSVELNEQQVEEMMEAYDSLSVFPDVATTMETLQANPKLRAVVFSNGTRRMVTSSVKNSPDLAKYSHIFEDVVVVDDVQVFKPAPETYLHLVRKLGGDPSKLEDLAQVWLVSGNPFDILGARHAGLNAIYVDRAGVGWQDALVDDEDKGRPTKIVTSLDQVISHVAHV